MQTILGANGTIGSLLARELVKYTDKIRLVSRHPRKVNETDELYSTDLTNPLNIDQAIEGSEVVYLVVGLEYDIRIWEEKWPALMRATINSCVKYKARLVFFDNVYMYDVNAIPEMTEESKINPPGRKGNVRKQISQQLLDEVKAGRLMALIARSADFYGPDNERSFVIELVYKNFLKGKRAYWFLDAGYKHSFTYTPDAAKATAILGNTEDAYNTVWHLPTDKNALTVRQFVSLFAKEMNVPDKLFVIPRWMIKIAGYFVPVIKESYEMLYQYDRDYIFDSSKFEKRFNFSPTTYQEGVRNVVKASERLKV
jgi:nucleoside-diphosphate-sugar epimerase